jgi:hypothetical protein
MDDVITNATHRMLMNSDMACMAGALVTLDMGNLKIAEGLA